jgi:hypothetical protein
MQGVYSASERAGLAAAKARGTKLGVPKGTKVKGSQVGRVRGAAANAAKADASPSRCGRFSTNLLACHLTSSATTLIGSKSR